MFHRAPVNIEAFGEEEFHGAEEDAGFEALASSREFFERGTGTDVEAALRDDRTFVEVHAHEVRGDARDFHAVFVGLTIGLRAGETRK